MKRRIFTILLALSLILSLCACGSKGQQSEQETVKSQQEAQASSDTPLSNDPADFDIDGYKQQVSELSVKISDASIVLANMGNWEYNFMKALGSPSKDMVERAYEWLAEESDYSQEWVEAKDEEIMSDFSNIAAITTGTQADNIFASLNDLMNVYIAMYCTVTTTPTSVSAFGEELSSEVSNFQTATKSLEAFIG